jgi:nucleoid DNA-binding protein/outer membrane biosynthesis protein TonB
MGKLTIQEIAAVLQQKNGFDKREANSFVSTMFQIIQERLESDGIVKIKGLGTFKMIDVEARESVSVRTGERVVISGHAKVTFTPDATMKELVNRPFSQFETVVLNEGVEFSDLKEQVEDLDDDLRAEQEEDSVELETERFVEEPVDEVVSQFVEQPVEQPVEQLVEESVEQETEQPVEPESEQPVEPETEQPIEPEIEQPVEQPVEEEESQSVEEFVFEEEESHSWGRWLLCALGVLALMALSAYGGYYYGTHESQTVLAKVDTVVVHDTVATAPVDTIAAVQQQAVEEPVSQPAEQPVEKPAAQPQVEPKKPAEEAVDKYAQKDERVRLGAYRIVGLSHEVKVLAGQTFYSICKAHLGPDMECYVEVFNDLPRNPKIKEGQVIKIPKLQLKKKK